MAETLIKSEAWLGKAIKLQEAIKGEWCLNGFLRLGQFPRLMAYAPIAGEDALRDERPIQATLRFYTDARGRMRLSGELFWQIPVICQRCLDIFDQRLQVQVDSVLKDAKAKKLKASEEDCDVITIENSVPEWADLLEDDLLLALPIVHKHPIEQCKVQVVAAEPQELPSSESEDTQRPFEKLAELYQHKKSQ